MAKFSLSLIRSKSNFDNKVLVLAGYSKFLSKWSDQKYNERSPKSVFRKKNILSFPSGKHFLQACFLFFRGCFYSV